MKVNRKGGEGRKMVEGMGGEGREGNFQMFEILTATVLCSANMCRHFKFLCSSVERTSVLVCFALRTQMKPDEAESV